MFSRFTQKTVHWLLNTIELQFFLLIASLPILVCWGLPISLLSVIGNIIFAPFLCLFLGAAACMCLLTICSINNWVCAAVINTCTDAWYWVMEYASSSVLLYIPQPLFVFLPLPLLLLFFLYMHPRSHHAQSIRLCGMFMICMMTLLIWRMAIMNDHVMIGKQCVIKKDVVGIAIEYYGSAPRNIDNWLRYTLIPESARSFGSIYCSSFYFAKPTPSIIPFLESIIKELSPREVSFGYGDKKVLVALQEQLEKNGYKKKKGNLYALPS